MIHGIAEAGYSFAGIRVAGCHVVFRPISTLRGASESSLSVKH
jgi:hypothetical protein